MTEKTVMDITFESESEPFSSTAHGVPSSFDVRLLNLFAVPLLAITYHQTCTLMHPLQRARVQQ